MATNEPKEQSDKVIEAIRSSSQLAQHLGGLVASGKLTAIHIVPQRTWGKPFSAIVQGTEMIMTADFVDSQSKRIYDVGADDNYASKNLVFCIGHLAYHLEVLPIDPRGLTPAAFGEKRIAEEAGAFIAGWDDVVDASKLDQDSADKRIKHMSDVLMNLRYRFAFLKAMRVPEPIVIGPDGRVESTERNIAAIAAALKTSTLTDIE